MFCVCAPGLYAEPLFAVAQTKMEEKRGDVNVCASQDSVSIKSLDGKKSLPQRPNQNAYFRSSLIFYEYILHFRLFSSNYLLRRELSLLILNLIKFFFDSVLLGITVSFVIIRLFLYGVLCLPDGPRFIEISERGPVDRFLASYQS